MVSGVGLEHLLRCHPKGAINLLYGLSELVQILTDLPSCLVAIATMDTLDTNAPRGCAQQATILEAGGKTTRYRASGEYAYFFREFRCDWVFKR